MVEQATILASRLPEHHNKLLAAYLCIYLYTYQQGIGRASTRPVFGCWRESRVKGRRGGWRGPQRSEDTGHPEGRSAPLTWIERPEPQAVEQWSPKAARPSPLLPRRVGPRPHTGESRTPEGGFGRRNGESVSRPKGGKDGSPQGSRRRRWLDAQHDSPARRETPGCYSWRTGRRWPATPAPAASSLTDCTKSSDSRCITRSMPPPPPFSARVSNHFGPVTSSSQA